MSDDRHGNGSGEHFDALAILKEILTVAAVLVIVYLWTMLMQLIVSFVALSYITLKLKYMNLAAIAVAVIFTVIWEICRVHWKQKYNRLLSGNDDKGSSI